MPLLWDGYEMAAPGEPAKALGWTLFAALAGGFLSLLVMVPLAEPLAKIALSVLDAEYFALVFFGLASVVSLGGGSLINALHLAVHRPADRDGRRRQHLRRRALRVRHATLCATASSTGA